MARRDAERRAATALAALLALVAPLVAPARAHAGPAGPVVVTEGGSVQGKASQGAEQFLGVPYAAPPLGALRFRPPQPVLPWKGVLDATELRAACPQLAGANGPETSDEDCLHVSVYRPVTLAGDAPRPVFVWIHGGSLLNGSGNQQDASAFAARTGTVVVMVNYRLNVFGFLALPELTAESDDASSGNGGFLDQQAALGWVHRNVAAFGGDPARVTVGGQSAGGASVCAQLASPTAAGLFQRAIVHSGAFEIPGTGIPPCGADTLANVEAAGASFATHAGCTDPASALACLRALPAADLLAASTGFSAGINASGAALPLALPDAIRARAWNRVPVLIGTTHDELQSAALALAGGSFPLPVETYEAVVRLLYRDSADKILKRYPADAYTDPAFALGAVLTDTGFACPTDALRRLLAKQTTVYGYEFDDPDAPPGMQDGFPTGAYHTADVQYLFTYTPPNGPLSPAQTALSEQMMDSWGAFVADGVPAAEGAPRWPRFRSASARVLSLAPGGGTRAIGDFARFHACKLWKRVK